MYEFFEHMIVTYSWLMDDAQACQLHTLISELKDAEKQEDPDRSKEKLNRIIEAISKISIVSDLISAVMCELQLAENNEGLSFQLHDIRLGLERALRERNGMLIPAKYSELYEFLNNREVIECILNNNRRGSLANSTPANLTGGEGGGYNRGYDMGYDSNQYARNHDKTINIDNRCVDKWKGPVDEQINKFVEQQSDHGTSPVQDNSRVDNVHFTVISPSPVTPGGRFNVEVWAHLGPQYEEVLRYAKDNFSGESIRSKTKGPVGIARNTMITIRLELEGADVEIPEDQVYWNGEPVNADFRVKMRDNIKEGKLFGRALAYVNGLQIARIYFDIPIGLETHEVARLPAREEYHKTAFASYSSKDRDQVLARIQGMEKIAPHLKVFVDVVSLRSGDKWAEELWKIIPECDVFYLFWSESAKSSEWVEKEWRCALKTRGINFIDPVPLVSPEKVPPPPELAEKHFYDRMLAFMKTS
jgi:hypothetical protein